MKNEIHKDLISRSQIKDVKQVDHFKNGMYSNLDIPATLDFYYNRYVLQLKAFEDITKTTIISDIGAGYGWLSIAFAFNTESQIIAIEPNEPRLKAGEKIAEILGVGDRIDWRIGALGNLPLKDKESNVSYCIEVLEHVNRNPNTLMDLCRVTNNLIVLTTPNLWFPKIAHDTQLPFCHWLPIPIRKKYARLFNRTDRENDNLFWSPYTLKKNMKDFERISSWLHYNNFSNYLDTFPFYLPYGKGRIEQELGANKRIYYRLISIFGVKSHIFVPNLAGVFKRSD